MADVPVITITNLKGGTGKSTLCMALGTTLCHWRHSVAVIDADPQGTISDYFAQAEEKGIRRPSLHHITSEEALDATIDQAARNHAFVIIDTPARLASPSRRALVRSDLALIPILASTSSIRSLRHMEPLIDGARSLLPSLSVLLVPNRIERGKVTDLALKELRSGYGAKYAVWDGQLGKRCVHDKAELLGEPVITLGDKAANEEVTLFTQNVVEAVA